MGNNVIILGAGYSFDAGIPLLRDFVETMWQLAMTKKCRGNVLSAADCQVFENAVKVRNALDSYHGRANFDDRNIEDILSILSFNVLSGSEAAKEQLSAINKAIARTIEATCNVTHPGIPKDGPWRIVENGSGSYRGFWNFLLRRHFDGRSFPTIITFNYDLVLERALLQLMMSKALGNIENRPRIFDFRINYHYKNVPNEILRLESCAYGRGFEETPGTLVKKTGADGSSNLFEIDLLKLHGSVNFPATPIPKEEFYNIAEARNDPYILPPIFNKLSAQSPNEMWKVALERLSKAQNIIIVGYSLPQTDIYMQYFLKAAIGPNVDLNKIFVFNPTLFRGDESSHEMQRRYELCFSEQLRKRIVFIPNSESVHVQSHQRGTMEHFFQFLRQSPGELLFD